MEYEFHKAADLFPMMTDGELEALGDDMLQNSQREPIILFKGQILDGRNRYKACLLKGINPRFREELPADPYAFVATANLHRRHLDASQRAMIAATLATLRDGQHKAGASEDAATQSDAADLLKVSRPSVQRARYVKDHGVPDLVDAVEQGDVTVSAAAKFAKQNPPIEQARLIAEAKSAGAAVKAASASKRTPSDIAKADRAATPRPKPTPDVTATADRAEAKAAAKAASSDNMLIGLLLLFERMRDAINLDTAIDDLSKTDLANMNALITRAHGWMGILVNKLRARENSCAEKLKHPICE